MDFVKIKTHLQVTSRMFAALWNQETTLSQWRKKHAEMHRLAQLLTWENLPRESLGKALTAYEEIYATITTREDWLNPNVEDYSISWRWITHRVYESLRDANYLQLSTTQEEATQAMMIDTVYNISSRYQIWKLPVPDAIQVFALTKYPRGLPKLKDAVSTDLASTYQPELWALICSLDALYGSDDKEIKNTVLEAWFNENANGTKAPKTQLSYSLPSDFIIS